SGLAAFARSRVPRSPSQRRHELAHQGEHSGTQNHHHQSREDEKHQRRHHFYSGLSAHFFGALTTLDTQVVGENAQRLSDASAEAVRLNQHGHQRFDVFKTGTTAKFAKGVEAGLADAHLEVDELEFFAELGVRDADLLRNFHQRLIETEA